jgi:hypothetical protein
LYLNDGRGNLLPRPDAVPAGVNTSASVVTGADLSGDGHTTVFVGGRMSAQLPLSPKSYLLRSDGRGGLVDVTTAVCPALDSAGMVTAAVFTDFDGDGGIDLVIAGEWMPLRFFSNRNGRLVEVSAGLSNMSGQWRSLVAADVDGDGDMDLIAGNLGLNNKYHVSAEQPLVEYAGDIDQNGIVDAVPFYYIKDRSGSRKLFPGIGRDQLAQQVPGVKKQFLYYANYALAGPKDIYNEGATYKCEETRSGWFENKGKGQFIFHPFPMLAQLAPVNAIVFADLNGDGFNDLLLAGNEYQTEPMTGRYDASCGLLLTGDGRGGFTAVASARSGIMLDGDVKDMRLLSSGNGGLFVLAAINNDSLRLFKLNHPGNYRP